MSRNIGLILIFVCMLALVPLDVGSAQTPPPGCDVIYPDPGKTEEKYLICIPHEWNGDLLIVPINNVYLVGHIFLNLKGTQTTTVLLKRSLKRAM